MSGVKYSDPLTPSGGPFRYRDPSDHLGLNPCLSPQIVDGFFYISIEHRLVDLTYTYRQTQGRIAGTALSGRRAGKKLTVWQSHLQATKGEGVKFPHRRCSVLPHGAKKIWK